MKVRVGGWLGEQSWSPPKRGEGRLSRASVSLVGALENGPKPSRGCNPLEKKPLRLQGECKVLAGLYVIAFGVFH